MAGCSALPQLGPEQAPPAAVTASPTPSPSAPSVTAQDVTAILADYIKRNNTANKNLSDKLLATYEGGSSLAIDKAGYTSVRKLGRSAGAYHPFEYVKPVHTVTKQGNWFLVTTHWKSEKETSKEPTYLLFIRDGKSWRQVYSPHTFEGTTADDLPQIAVDASGAAEEVAPSDSAGLMMSPAAFAKSYAAHLANKGSAASRSRFAADRLTTTAASNRAKMRTYAKVTESARPATQFPSYALRTADGGALAFTTIKRTIRYDVHQGPGRRYVHHDNNGFLRGKYSTFMKSTTLIQVAAHIPPKTAEPGQVQVIASYSGIIAGSGR